MYRSREKQTALLDERLAEMKLSNSGTRPQRYRPANNVKRSNVNCGKQEIAANITRWASSPGLQPPKFFVESAEK